MLKEANVSLEGTETDNYFEPEIISMSFVKSILVISG
jgi:hypothetical protein